MSKYRLVAMVTVSCYTIVEAGSEKEAIDEANDRSVSMVGRGDELESWVIEEADGEPQEIRLAYRVEEYYIPATVRADWKLPVPPYDEYTLAVYCDGESWELGWEDEDGDFIDSDTSLEWPFIEEEVWAKDWEKLGIVVM